ncbi:MAG: phospho-sugar mutase [Nocardioidaceae bacterium]|nr:phospho-sugar mutase [Nocardioidaceae bacterium]
MSVEASLRARVEAWIADDPDATAQAELAELLTAAESDPLASSELTDRFTGRLQFGTAGLRGQLAAGPNRMNRAVVVRAAAGLASYLKTAVGEGTVVIGYDARRKSDEFARDSAEVMRGAGLQAVVLPRPLPTPVLAFAIGHLHCIAGVMVTASHNPPADNGYKVYLGDGSQIVPPVDGEISTQIDTVTSAADVPKAAGWSVAGEEVVEAYIDAVAALPDPATPRVLTMAYTPLHGVGDETVERVLLRAGFSAPLAVPEQVQPDPGFPTVAFPNPEEPGAMDLAIALAAQVGADLAVANDPDADRCAVAVPVAGGWRMLRGDELGVLLGHHLLSSGTRGVFATTIVSSSLLGRMAHEHGVDYVETLTGFKWIGRVPGLSFGYEEALGYCVAPQLVRDKDGISALLLVAELAASLKARGSNLLERLDHIAAQYGVYATDQLSVRVSDLTLIDAAMNRLRAKPPSLLGGYRVERVEDLSVGSDELPPTEGLRYRLADGGRVVVRPSGTEPKIKCYLEVVLPVEAGGVDASRIAATGRLDAIRNDLAAAAGLPRDSSDRQVGC